MSQPPPARPRAGRSAAAIVGGPAQDRRRRRRERARPGAHRTRSSSRRDAIRGSPGTSSRPWPASARNCSSMPPQAIPRFDRPVLLVWGDSCEFFPIGRRGATRVRLPRRDAARRARSQDLGPGRRSGARWPTRSARTFPVHEVDPGVAARLGSAAHPLQEEVGHGSSRPPCPSGRRRIGRRTRPRRAGRGARPGVEVVASGLDNPRGLDLADGTLWVTEAGRGGAGPCVPGPEGTPVCFGLSGALTAVDLQGHTQTRVLKDLPSLANPDGSSATGPSDISFGAEGALDDHRARRPVDDAGPAPARGPGHGQAVPARAEGAWTRSRTSTPTRSRTTRTPRRRARTSSPTPTRSTRRASRSSSPTPAATTSSR